MRYALLMFLLLQACGAKPKVDMHFHFSAVETDDPALEQRVLAQAAYFNHLMGGEYLLFDGIPGDRRTSTISIGSNLQKEHVGEGSHDSGRFSLKTAGIAVKEEVKEIMHLSFDEKYMQENDDEGFRLVFLHEVGHGLKMEHSLEQTDVMYPDISVAFRSKDVGAYLDRATAFVEHGQ